MSQPKIPHLVPSLTPRLRRPVPVWFFPPQHLPEWHCLSEVNVFAYFNSRRQPSTVRQSSHQIPRPPPPPISILNEEGDWQPGISTQQILTGIQVDGRTLAVLTLEPLRDLHEFSSPPTGPVRLAESQRPRAGACVQVRPPLYYLIAVHVMFMTCRTDATWKTVTATTARSSSRLPSAWLPTFHTPSPPRFLFEPSHLFPSNFSAGIRPFCSECRSGNYQTASCCVRVLSPTPRPCLHKNGIHNWMAWTT
jgi:hypothetical protein